MRHLVSPDPLGEPVEGVAAAVVALHSGVVGKGRRGAGGEEGHNHLVEWVAATEFPVVFSAREARLFAFANPELGIGFLKLISDADIYRIECAHGDLNPALSHVGRTMGLQF